MRTGLLGDLRDARARAGQELPSDNSLFRAHAVGGVTTSAMSIAGIFLKSHCTGWKTSSIGSSEIHSGRRAAPAAE
jgi:hypothetical protein